MIDEIKKEIEKAIEDGQPYVYDETLNAILDKYNNQKNDESPYCEVCGTCGYIGCCGIRNFIKEHIEGKTNCKNEACIIDEIISLCEYKNDVFKENEKLLNFKNAWEELYSEKEMPCSIEYMQNLEEKHNLDKE